MNTDGDGHLKLEKVAQLFYSNALRDIGDQPLSQAQKYMFSLGANAYRLKKNETIPLHGFLSSVAVEAWLSGAVDEQPFDEAAVGVAYQAILQAAKSDILDRKLEVLELVSLAPMNDVDRVRSWCLPSSSEDLGETISGLVVSPGAAGRWLQKTGFPVPEWLHVDAAALADNVQVAPVENPPRGIHVAEHEEGKDVPIREQIRKRYAEMKRAGFRPMLKTLMREFNRSESGIKKHLPYRRKAKNKGSRN